MLERGSWLGSPASERSQVLLLALLSQRWLKGVGLRQTASIQLRPFLPVLPLIPPPLNRFPQAQHNIPPTPSPPPPSPHLHLLVLAGRQCLS
jgi:hypothetical protein